jgi:hypothetical protein
MPPASEEEKNVIPVGFSPNDFFFKNVTAPVNMSKPENENLCSYSDDQLKQIITQYYNDLDVSINSIQPTLINANMSNDYFNTFGVTNSGALDQGIQNFPKTVEGKDELIKKTLDYYKLICKNKELSGKLQQTLSKNLDGEVKLQDLTQNYNREYLNRINLGIGIILICGLIFYCFTTNTSVLPSIKIPEIPKMEKTNVNNEIKK